MLNLNIFNTSIEVNINKSGKQLITDTILAKPKHVTLAI